MKIFGSILLISCFLALIFYPVTVPLSPLAPQTTKFQPQATSYAILGFAPYWLQSKITEQATTTITHYAYFALLLNKDGQLYTHIKASEQEPGYTNYQKLLQASIERPLILTFMPESQSALAALLSSPQSRKNTITTITNALQESRAVGVNIDFEPLGATPPSLRANFTHFIQELDKAFVNNNYLLTISLYPSAASRPRLWDLTNLAPITDYFVVMTYDYTLPGEGKSGPNSPLRGAGQLFEHDVIKNLAELTKIIAPAKILLGIPFYGYEWNVATSEKYPASDVRASVASLERIQTLIDQQVLELLWDRNSLTPYAVRREEGQIISQIYYENENSIKLKLDLVKNAGLGGIAIWALGYEGDNQKIWHTINSLQTSNP